MLLPMLDTPTCADGSGLVKALDCHARRQHPPQPLRRGVDLGNLLGRRPDRLLAMPAITPAGAELQRQTKRWSSRFFTFITSRDVPPTNNAAERALRSSVIFQKVTNGFRSIWGAHVHALAHCVIGTGRLHGLAPHQAISHALARQSNFATCSPW